MKLFFYERWIKGDKFNYDNKVFEFVNILEGLKVQNLPKID